MLLCKHKKYSTQKASFTYVREDYLVYAYFLYAVNILLTKYSIIAYVRIVNVFLRLC